MSITPLEILDKHLPREIINYIQQYLTYEIANTAIREYFEYLEYKKEQYEDFVLDNYVFPNCQCVHAPENGQHKVYKRKDCSECFKFDCTYEDRMTPAYITCIYENRTQYSKIMWKRNYIE